MNPALKDKFRPLCRFFGSDQAFRSIYICTFFLASLCLIRDYFYIAAGVLMIWGTALAAYKIIVRKQLSRMRNKRLIVMFLGFAVLTNVIHCKTHFFDNMYIVVYMGLCFFFFYGLHAGKCKSRCRRETAMLLDFLLAGTTVIMTAGLVLLVMYPSGFEIGGDAFAIHENRFVGIIFNANVTAFYSLMGIIICNILWAMKNASGRLSIVGRIWYIVCFSVNGLALILTDSNDALLFMIVYGCFIAFYVLFKGFRPTVLNLVFRIIAFALACIIIASALIAVRTLVQQGVAYLFTISKPVAPAVQSVPGVKIPQPAPSAPPTTFEHQNTNIDSGRFVIWRQSVGLFKEFPVFGIGKQNIVDYGEYYLGGLRYGDFHNGLITIIISYGLVGFFIFMVLAIAIAKVMLKAIFRYRNENRRDGRVLMYITAFCTAYCAYSMFEVALLVDLSYRVLIFWLMIGLALSYTDSYERRALLHHENLPLRSREIYAFAAQYAAK